MRTVVITIMALLLSPSVATAGVCSSVSWRSFGQIQCSKVKKEGGYIFVVRYSPGALSIVKVREERKNLINALCAEGATQVREIDGYKKYVHYCGKVK